MCRRLLILTCAALAVAAAPAAARPLVWAGDAEGGAPYVFRDPDHPDRYIGFEVDLAAALAQRAGPAHRVPTVRLQEPVPGPGPRRL